MFLQRSKAGKAFQLVRESTRNNVSTVFWRSGTLRGKTETIEIPVDSESQRITFAFSTDTKGNKLILMQPSGGAISESSASAEIAELNCGRVVTISTPEAGNWRAEISGTGRFWSEAQAQSDIHFITAEFVKEAANSAETRELRLDANESGNVIVQLSVPASTAAPAGDDLVVVAASTAGPPPTTNSCVVHLTVAGPKGAN
jgi:hypothetical protein